MKQLLAPSGCVLVDSSDLRYIYEDEDGALDIDLNAGYYGELDFRMQYKRVKGAPFPVALCGLRHFGLLCTGKRFPCGTVAGRRTL